ncbi:hypothetical protein G5I_02149 [Acromyrmex echinatior]|uniref:Uncharacterized protein n=1 Tax=Acromyrmex echinatior TaxID=103372 RepID=F4W9J7_ACREC|nr:hypothetical protein G5I_02149 [Acromyrmex echinatior]
MMEKVIGRLSMMRQRHMSSGSVELNEHFPSAFIRISEEMCRSSVGNIKGNGNMSGNCTKIFGMLHHIEQNKFRAKFIPLNPYPVVSPARGQHHNIH